MLAAALVLGVSTSQAGFPGNNGLIAFYSDKGETDGIWTVGPDGSNRTRVFQGFGAGTPDWSSNGVRIAFGIPSDTSASLGSGIYMMNADGSDRVRITNGPDCCPSWSPDGKRRDADQGKRKVRRSASHESLPFWKLQRAIVSREKAV